VGSLGREHQTKVGVKTAIFRTFAHHIFRTFKSKANIIAQPHEMPFELSNDLEMCGLE